LVHRIRLQTAFGGKYDPTLLELMELPKPKEMTGGSLLRAD
jgi:bisphosphoglycerate-independent phosphoglycerate mutase (AlkP superfamily)